MAKWTTPRFTGSLNLGRPQLKIIVSQSGVDLKDFVDNTNRYLQSFRKPLSAIREYLYNDVFTRNFDTSSGESKWEPISDVTKKWRIRNRVKWTSGSPLVAMGALRSAATMSGMYRTSARNTAEGKIDPDKPSSGDIKLTFRSSIGRRVIKGNVKREGYLITGSSKITDHGRNGGRLSLALDGSTERVRKAILALHNGSKDGSIPRRDFWFVSSKDYAYMERMTKQWVDSVYKKSMEKTKKVSRVVSKTDSKIGRDIIAGYYGR